MKPRHRQQPARTRQAGGSSCLTKTRESLAARAGRARLQIMAGLIASVMSLSAQPAILTAHGEKAVVLLFIRSDCPVSNRYAPELERLYRTWSPRGVDFLLVYPEPGLSEAAMKEHWRAYGYSIPAVLDPKHEYADRARAHVTPEAAVFVQGRLVYTGRIDDWFYDFGKSRPQAEHHDLEEELTSVLAGKATPYRETRAIGCAIENVR